jgi:hypothetical protein
LAICWQGCLVVRYEVLFIVWECKSVSFGGSVFGARSPVFFIARGRGFSFCVVSFRGGHLLLGVISPWFFVIANAGWLFWGSCFINFSLFYPSPIVLVFWPVPRVGWLCSCGSIHICRKTRLICIAFSTRTKCSWPFVTLNQVFVPHLGLSPSWFMVLLFLCISFHFLLCSSFVFCTYYGSAMDGLNVSVFPSHVWVTYQGHLTEGLKHVVNFQKFAKLRSTRQRRIRTGTESF